MMSVCRLRITHSSSATVPRWGNSSLIGRPDWPCCKKRNGNSSVADCQSREDGLPRRFSTRPATLRFGIERVDVRETAREEDDDQLLGPCRMARPPRREGISAVHGRRERQGPVKPRPAGRDSESCELEKVATPRLGKFREDLRRKAGRFGRLARWKSVGRFAQGFCWGSSGEGTGGPKFPPCGPALITIGQLVDIYKLVRVEEDAGVAEPGFGFGFLRIQTGGDASRVVGSRNLGPV